MNSADRSQVHTLKDRARNALILGAFNDYLISKRSCSPLTLESYSSELRRFETFLSEQKKKSLLQAKRRDVRAFLEYRRASGVVERTLAHVVSVLRHFHKYLVLNSFSRRNATIRIACPTQRKELPEAFDKAEIQKMASSKNSTAAETIGQAITLRDRAILAVLYAGALQASELLALKLEDIDIQAAPGFVSIQGEGSRNRICALDDDAITALRNYLNGSRQLLAKPESGTALFIGRSGRPLTRQRLWKLVRNASANTGQRMSPNTLRHSRARHMVESGADLRTVQQFLGYSDIKNAKVYALLAAARNGQYLHSPGRSKRAAEDEQVLFRFAKHLERRDPPLSFNSITAYQSDARLFIAFLRRHGAGIFPPPAELESGYLESLRFKPDTVQRKAGALRHFREFIFTLPWPRRVSEDHSNRLPRQDATANGPTAPLQRTSTLDKLVQQFASTRQTQRTSSAYDSDLRQFIKFCGENIDPAAAAPLAQVFLDQVADTGNRKSSSVCRLTATLRSFFRWAQGNGHIARVPTIRYAGTADRNVKPQPPREQIEEAIRHLDKQASARDAAVIHLLREGLTPAEIVALNVSNFQPQFRGIVATGRKQRQRYLVASLAAAEAIAALIRQSRAPEEKNVPLITNHLGGRLTTRSVGRIVKRFVSGAGLPDHIHPLSIRHAGAHFRKRDPHRLKYQLGLAGAAATTRYL